MVVRVVDGSKEPRFRSTVGNRSTRPLIVEKLPLRDAASFGGLLATIIAFIEGLK